MPPFISQPTVQFRGGRVDFAPLGNAIADVANTVRTQNALKRVGDVIRSGGSEEEVARALIDSGLGPLQATGLERFRDAQRRSEDVKFRDSQTKESARRFGITSKLQGRRVAAAEAAAKKGSFAVNPVTGQIFNKRTGRADGDVRTPDGSTPALENFRAKERIKQEEKTRGKRVEGQNVGNRVLRMIDDFETKLIGSEGPRATKSQRAIADRFSSAAGPFEDSFIGRGVGEIAAAIDPTGTSRENTERLTRIKQRAQGIRTVLQRAFLAGQGQVTENEREQINQILGEIGTAKNARFASQRLGTLRDIVTNAFGIGDATTGGAVQTTRSGIQFRIK